IHARITAQWLSALGIIGNFAPVLDLYIEGASSAIGDRAISRDPEIIASLAGAMIQTYMNNGILPVIKHMPGHGRVKVDPHLSLPVVDESLSVLEEDFAPFIRLKDAPLGMNCHVVFKAIDPDHPVSLSRKAHEEIIRGKIGFNGLLFSDDLAMKALEGDLGEIALQALDAGADFLLYCPGTMPGMKQIASVLPPISRKAYRRWQKALSGLSNPGYRYQPEADLQKLEGWTKAFT
ncbi:MAG: glycoside hydrolase family 3 N-terminal domain-containing protein, partial [Alphaproteobacteria bacterium]|nr:glycoside hydrolase family 3 N-terminal domain-containing protein [Alphaproteobacteria bacterium]